MLCRNRHGPSKTGRTLALLLALLAAATAQGALKSPWDVEYRRLKPLGIWDLSRHAAADDFRCATPIYAPADLSASDIYKPGGQQDERDPDKLDQYHQQVRPYTRSAEVVVDMADKYLGSHDPVYAQCAVVWLNSLAEDNALGGEMKTMQANNQRSWSLASYAIAWLKVRNAPNLDANEVAAINAWLAHLAEADAAYFSQQFKNGSRSQAQNLAYWAGLAVISGAIAADRQDLFDWAVARYRAGLDSLTPEGFLPAELKRGRAARSYHLYAVEPLSSIAQLASTNQVNLYAYGDYAIKRLVGQILLSVQDAQRITQLAGAEQPALGQGTYFGWLPYVLKRLPDFRLAALGLPILRQYPERSSLQSGGVQSLYP